MIYRLNTVTNDVKIFADDVVSFPWWRTVRPPPPFTYRLATAPARCGDPWSLHFFILQYTSTVKYWLYHHCRVIALCVSPHRSAPGSWTNSYKNIKRIVEALEIQNLRPTEKINFFTVRIQNKWFYMIYKWQCKNRLTQAELNRCQVPIKKIDETIESEDKTSVLN